MRKIQQQNPLALVLDEFYPVIHSAPSNNRLYALQPASTGRLASSQCK
jgi:hypothetical protein